MKRTTLALTLLLILAGTSASEDTATTIPGGAPPTIDGTLATEEWEDALRVDLAPDGEAFLLHDEHALYVGLRAGQNCLPSLALLQGEKIKVLHASASLGTATYERSGEGWKATGTFAWRCRSGKTSDSERKRFLEDEGWLATTTDMGRGGEAEYRIERRLLTDAPPRLAVVACRVAPGSPTACAWPATVKDGTTDRDLLFGRTPELDFDPETWARLDIGGARPSAKRFEAALDDVEAAAAKNPVKAYVALLDLLDAHRDAKEGRDRANRLRRALEGRKTVAREATAQRRLGSALKLARKKLKEITEKYAGTRAAGIAEARLEALEP